MSSDIGPARIGQWYLRRDKGEMFLVTGTDERAGTVEVQTFDGDIDEIDVDTWRTLPLEAAAAPEDWTGPVDEVAADDLGYSETDMRSSDWAQPLQPFAAPGVESWQDETSEPDDSGVGEPVDARETVRAPEARGGA